MEVIIIVICVAADWKAAAMVEASEASGKMVRAISCVIRATD